MTEYDQRSELMAMHQSLLGEYECQLNKEIKKNMVILCNLSWWEQAGEHVPCREFQQVIKGEKQNAFKLLALKNFNEEVPSVAEEQRWQLEVHAQSISTDSESEAEEHEVVGPKTTTASAKIANISQQNSAL